MGVLIITERLFLRSFTMNDAEEAHRYFGDRKVMARIPSGACLTADDTRKRIATFIKLEKAWGISLWAATLKESGKIIGDCGLFPSQGKCPEIEIAYRFARDYWGKGFASEAAQAALDYGLKILKIDRIIALTDPDHTASRRIMVKLGMKYCATRQCFDREMVVYEILNDG